MYVSKFVCMVSCVYICMKAYFDVSLSACKYTLAWYVGLCEYMRMCMRMCVYVHACN